MNARKGLLAATVIAACGTAARADLIIGQPIVFQDTPRAVTLRFVSSEAAWDGVLWIDADSARDHVEVPLFLNHDSAAGYEVPLGIFNPGERLDFIYDVISGEINSFRTDDAAGIMQFGWEVIDSNTTRIGIEDIRLPGGDHDYNDMVFEMHTVPVPAPGAGGTGGALAAAILGFGRRRRRC